MIAAHKPRSITVSHSPWMRCQLMGFCCRLSRPDLSRQHPLPPQSLSLAPSPRAALSIPDSAVDDAFIISPLVCRLNFLIYKQMKADARFRHSDIPSRMWLDYAAFMLIISYTTAKSSTKLWYCPCWREVLLHTMCKQRVIKLVRPRGYFGQDAG